VQTERALPLRPDGSSPPSSAAGLGDELPQYLEPFIVEQDPSRYSAVDQAVWRFVLLQLHARLALTAHPSYVQGLAESGISAEHIPSIAEMNRRLGAIGWRAVCVDGFIPPRAFQAFQALGVLPIAAEIRTPEHLPYTPAPDIIHEAAGHAPILIDLRYAAYLRASGRVASRAFANPSDARVDRAVRLLSDLKETANALPDDLRAAEVELEQAVATLGPPSEAARVSRLYWWTAEYGLVGGISDYRLYGAGLLSSLGESHFCHRPEVAKLPLSARCVEVGYDITRPQPQLFVARDFEHLHSVLDEVSRSLACSVGGSAALRTALSSRELCTVELDTGAELIGVLSELVDTEAGALLGFDPGVALIEAGRLACRVGTRYLLPVGRLADGSDPRRLIHDPGSASDGRVRLAYASGVTLHGSVLERSPTSTPSSVPASSAGLWLRDVMLERPGRAPEVSSGPQLLLLAASVVTAGAGSTCAEVSPLGAEGLAQARALGSRPRVPKARQRTERAAQLEALYAQTAELRREPAASRAARIAAVHAALELSQPHEWLLRWNLLECLTDLGRSQEPLARQLRARLVELEHHYRGEHPIALGLDYLASHT